MSRESMYVTDKTEFDAIDPDKVDSLLGNGILYITPVSNLLNHCEQHIHNNNKHLLHHTRNQPTSYICYNVNTMYIRSYIFEFQMH